MTWKEENMPGVVASWKSTERHNTGRAFLFSFSLPWVRYLPDADVVEASQDTSHRPHDNRLKVCNPTTLYSRQRILHFVPESGVQSHDITLMPAQEPGGETVENNLEQ